MSDGNDPFVRTKRAPRPVKRKQRRERLSFTQDSDSDSDGVHANAPLHAQNALRAAVAKRNLLKSGSARKTFVLPNYLPKLDKVDISDDDAINRDYSKEGLQRLHEQQLVNAPRDAEKDGNAVVGTSPWKAASKTPSVGAKLSFAEESDSDRDTVAHSGTVKRSTVFTNGSTKTTFAPSNALPKFGKMGISEEDDQDAEERLDYSKAGLQRLRENQLGNDARVNSIVGRKNAAPAATLKNAEPVRKNDEAHGNGSNFVAKQRERTEEALGALGLDELSGCDAIADEGGSSAEEWEREQLRRAGQTVRTTPVEMNVRSIIEEEELAVGEIGLNVVDVCLEGLDEAVRTNSNHVLRCEARLDVVRAATKGSVDALKEHDDLVRLGEAKVQFYIGLSQFAVDISDMLEDRAARIDAVCKRRMEQWTEDGDALRRELSADTDDFGRAIDVAAVIRRRYSYEEEAERGEEDEEDDVFEDVEMDFRSISRISAVFRDWRSRHGEEYQRAFGNKSVGKICGRIAQGEIYDARQEWIHDVLRDARAFAIEAYSGREVIPLALFARWRPTCSSSTREYYCVVRTLSELQGKYVYETCELVWEAFIERFNVELNLLSRAAEVADVDIVDEACMDLIRNAITFYMKGFEKLPARKSQLIRLMLTEVSECLARVCARSDNAEQRTDAWMNLVDAVSEIGPDYVDEGSWESVRQHVRREGERSGNDVNKVRLLCARLKINLSN